MLELRDIKDAKRRKSMKLLIIRHGDPNYSIDSLTEKGWREAEYLSERLSGMDIKKFYVSSMGRAKDTASFTLKKMGRSAEECEWLREFAPLICHPGEKEEKIVWDWLPQDWTKEERFYQKDHWFEPELLREAKVREEYEWVTGELDCIFGETRLCAGRKLLSCQGGEYGHHRTFSAILDWDAYCCHIFWESPPWCFGTAFARLPRRLQRW